MAFAEQTVGNKHCKEETDLKYLRALFIFHLFSVVPQFWSWVCLTFSSARAREILHSVRSPCLQTPAAHAWIRSGGSWGERETPGQTHRGGAERRENEKQRICRRDDQSAFISKVLVYQDWEIWLQWWIFLNLSHFSKWAGMLCFSQVKVWFLKDKVFFRFCRVLKGFYLANQHKVHNFEMDGKEQLVFY